MRRPGPERRKYPRVEEKLPLKLKDGEFDAITISKNISCSGVFCQVDKPFPLLSKVKVVLLFPTEGRRKAQPIYIDGTVVRSVPVKSTAKTNCYNIAIFFNKIKNQDRSRISNYVNSILAQRKAIVH